MPSLHTSYIFCTFFLVFCQACHRDDSPVYTDRSRASEISLIDSAGDNSVSDGSLTPKPDNNTPPKTVETGSADISPWITRLQSANFRQVKPVSSRSSSVRLIFEDGKSAIFKPLKKDDRSARLEVAFYRIAALLGVKRVPVSVMRGIYPSRIEPALAKEGTDVLAKFMSAIERDDKGRVYGAMIEWLEDLVPVGAENEKGKIDVKTLFTNDEFLSIRRSISQMVMLDYLLSNWDRFSGGNLFRVKNSETLALIDHNEAFYNLSDKQAEKLESALMQLPCADEALVERIRGLTKEKIAAAVLSAEWNRSLLNDEEMENILKRKEKLLAFTDAKKYKAGMESLPNCPSAE